MQFQYPEGKDSCREFPTFQNQLQGLRTSRNVFLPHTNDDALLHPTGGARSSSHGHRYQHKLTMLWLYRAHRSELKFEASIEDERAGKFDDFCMTIMLEDGTKIRQFNIQTKHASQKNANLTLSDLFPTENIKNKASDKHAFDLRTYFQSLLKIKSELDEKVMENPKQMFIIYTNRKLEFDDDMTEASIMETIVETNILKTEILKFHNSFKDKQKYINMLTKEDVDKENDANKFLENFYIAESQLGESELEALIKKEMGQEFKGIHCENAYNKFYKESLEWFQETGNKKGKSLNDSLIRSYFLTLKSDFLEQTRYGFSDPVSNFSGRELELQEIHAYLSNNTGEYKIDILITGICGVGKSELARAYVKRVLEDFEYILWIDTSSVEATENSFLKLANFLHIKTDDKETKPRDKIDFNRIYESLFDKKCLFVLDNVANKERNDVVLPKVKSKSHVIIVTSQLNNFECNLKVELDIFRSDEILKFLKSNIPPEISESDLFLVYLGNALSCIPLALQIACSFIKEQNVISNILSKEKYTVRKFLQSYEENKSDILIFKDCENETKSLKTLCDMSIQSISKSHLKYSELALEILHIMALLGPVFIPCRIFQSSDISESQLAQSISILQNHSLVKVNSGFMSIHSLVQDVLRYRIQNALDIVKQPTKRDKYKQKHNSECKKSKGTKSNFSMEYLLQRGISMFIDSIRKHSGSSDALEFNEIILPFIKIGVQYDSFVSTNFEFIIEMMEKNVNMIQLLQCISIASELRVKVIQVFKNEFKNVFTVSFLLVEKLLAIGDVQEALAVALECKKMVCSQKNVEFIVQLKLANILCLIYKQNGNSEECYNELVNIYKITCNMFEGKKITMNNAVVSQLRQMGDLLTIYSMEEESRTLCEHLLSKKYFASVYKFENEINLITYKLSLNYMTQKSYEKAENVIHLVFFKEGSFARYENSELLTRVTVTFIHSLVCQRKIQGALEFVKNMTEKIEDTKTKASSLAFTLKVIIGSFAKDHNFFKDIQVMLLYDINAIIILNILEPSHRKSVNKFRINFQLENSVPYHDQFHFESLLFIMTEGLKLSKSIETSLKFLKGIENCIVMYMGYECDLYFYMLRCKIRLEKENGNVNAELESWKIVLKLCQMAENKLMIGFPKLLLLFNDFIFEMKSRQIYLIPQEIENILDETILMCDHEFHKIAFRAVASLTKIKIELLIIQNKFEEALEYAQCVMQAIKNNKLMTIKNLMTLKTVQLKAVKIYLKMERIWDARTQLQIVKKIDPDTINKIEFGVFLFYNGEKINVTVGLMTPKNIFEILNMKIIYYEIKLCCQAVQQFSATMLLEKWTDCVQTADEFQILKTSLPNKMFDIVLLLFNDNQSIQGAIDYLQSKLLNNSHSPSVICYARLIVMLFEKQESFKNAFSGYIEIWMTNMVRYNRRGLVQNFQNPDQLVNFHLQILKMRMSGSFDINSYDVTRITNKFFISVCYYLKRDFIQSNQYITKVIEMCNDPKYSSRYTNKLFIDAKKLQFMLLNQQLCE